MIRLLMKKSLWKTRKKKTMNKMCITSCVDETYAPYVPLFKYCVKKAYPEYDCIVFGMGNIDDTVMVDPLESNDSRFVPASMRFLIGDGLLDRYEYCLITDCDILIRRENPDIIKQHKAHMLCNNLKYYDNVDHGDHMPGVHFVTNEWWGKTEKAREKHLEALKNRNGMTAGMDEIMLKDIVMDCNMTVNKHIMLWQTHGIHLGRFRNCNPAAVRFQPVELGFLDELLNDPMFMALMEIAQKKSEIIRKTWKNLMLVYELRNKA